jgi:hypothetical protein
MGTRLSKHQEAPDATSKAGKSFVALYKINSEDASIRLGKIRMIVGYEDFMINQLLSKLDSDMKLGVKLLSELRRFEKETIITIRILNKRRLADRNDLYELVKKVEKTCDAIRDFLSSLQVRMTLPKAGDDCHEEALKVLEAVGERREDLLQLRMSLFPARTEVIADVERPGRCMEPWLTAITGRKRQCPARQTLKVTGVQTEPTAHSLTRGQASFDLQHPAVSGERTPLLVDRSVRNALIYETITGRPAPARRSTPEPPRAST